MVKSRRQGSQNPCAPSQGKRDRSRARSLGDIKLGNPVVKHFSISYRHVRSRPNQRAVTGCSRISPKEYICCRALLSCPGHASACTTCFSSPLYQKEECASSLVFSISSLYRFLRAGEVLSFILAWWRVAPMRKTDSLRTEPEVLY